MTTFVVRDSRDPDLQAMHAIYAHHVLHGLASFELQPPSLQEFCARRVEWLSRGMPCLVAVSPDKLLGYAYAGPYRPRPAYRYTVENSVYVSPDTQRGGVGSALLAALIAGCQARGMRQMIAVIGDSENQPSIGLHEKHGFTHAGLVRSVGFKHGRWVDSVIMQRPLGEADHTLPA